MKGTKISRPALVSDIDKSVQVLEQSVENIFLDGKYKYKYYL